MVWFDWCFGKIFLVIVFGMGEGVIGMRKVGLEFFVLIWGVGEVVRCGCVVGVGTLILVVDWIWSIFIVLGRFVSRFWFSFLGILLILF